MNKAEDPMQPHEDDALLTPSEVAAMFRVNPKTVTRWARAGESCTSGTWATSAPTRPTRRRAAGSCVHVAPT